jgi:hypothetical protein
MLIHPVLIISILPLCGFFEKARKSEATELTFSASPVARLSPPFFFFCTASKAESRRAFDSESEEATGVGVPGENEEYHEADDGRLSQSVASDQDVGLAQEPGGLVEEPENMLHWLLYFIPFLLNKALLIKVMAK